MDRGESLPNARVSTPAVDRRNPPQEKCLPGPFFFLDASPVPFCFYKYTDFGGLFETRNEKRVKR